MARRRSQRGFFTFEQALDAGLTSSQLSRWQQRGVIERAEPRVYRFVVGAAPTAEDRLAAKLLSTGGLACGLSAAALYDAAAAPVHPQTLVARGSHVAAHSTRELLPVECATVRGLRTLAPVRMVLDAAHRLPFDRAVTLVETTIVRGLAKPEALERRARELGHGKRPGCAVTLRILAQLHPELERSRNHWEALVVRRARAMGLPDPALEHEVVVDGRRYLADAAWPEAKVMLEFDGRDPHMRKRVHDNDSVRRNDLTSAGWRRFGLTAAALQRADGRVFRQVAAALAVR